MRPGPDTTGALDLHAHWIPPAVAVFLRQRNQPPCITRGADGRETLRMPVGELALSDSYFDLERRLDDLQRWGVTHQLLSLPGLFGLDSLALDLAVPVVRAFNDACVQVVREHADRFSALAALPLADPHAAADELARTCAAGLAGAILPIDAFASAATAQRLAPVLDRAQQLRAHLFLHPGRVPGAAPPAPAPADQGMARRALDVQHEVGQAMVTLLLTDLLDNWPDLTVQVANLGGTFPAVVERMEHQSVVRTGGSLLPLQRTRRVWVDTASLGPLAIEQAVAVFGADRVVLGTDCPIFDTPRTLDALDRARLSPADRRQIASGNAQVLLLGRR